MAAAEPATARLAYGDLVLDDDAHEVWEGEREVELSPTEFNLLRYFLQNPGRVLSKRQILEHVWHDDFGGDGNVVESYVSYLRKEVDQSEPRLTWSTGSTRSCARPSQRRWTGAAVQRPAGPARGAMLR